MANRFYPYFFMSSKRGGLGVGVALAVGGLLGALGLYTGKKYWDEHESLQREKSAVRHPQPSQRYGLFNCPNCGSDWTSYFSWVGESQQCENCDTWVEPVTLRIIDNHVLAKMKLTKLHQPQRCSRCVKYNTLCFQSFGDPTTQSSSVPDSQSDVPPTLGLKRRNSE